MKLNEFDQYILNSKDEHLELYTNFTVFHIIDKSIKKDLLKKMKDRKNAFIKLQKLDIDCIQQSVCFNGNIDIESVYTDCVREIDQYVYIYSLVYNDFNFFKSMVTATKLADEFVEILFQDVSEDFFKIKDKVKVQFIKNLAKTIYSEINKNEYDVFFETIKESNDFKKWLRYEKYISNKPILNILNKESDYINPTEFIKYIKRIEKYGEYKDLKAKEKAVFTIFNPPVETSRKCEITEYKYRDTMTSDYSDRMNYILKVLKLSGDKQTPVSITKNNFTVYKMGNALNDSDIELFYYLAGELEEHGCNGEITFRKSDFINNMNYKSIRGQKLDNLTSSLMNLGTQYIAIEDERKDKVGARLQKIDKRKIKGTPLIIIQFETIDNETLIYIESPFSKYFSQQKQFGRILNKDMISKYLFTNPRILKIAREITRMLYINSQKNRKINQLEINYDTLIKNVDEWDKYKSYSNKRVFLNRFNNDIEKALENIRGSKDNYNFELIKPTPTTIKSGKIKMLKSS